MDVLVTDLNTEHSHSGRVADVSRAGLCILLDDTIPVGTPLRLQAADSILYGFIVYATAEGSTFRIGIELQQVLVGGTDLSRLLENCLRAFLPQLAGLTSPEIYLG